jgi:hypothetical protein
MKFRFTLFAFLVSSLAFCQDIEGRWVNSSFSGDENLAYEFLEGEIVKMYYAGEEITTKKPVGYDLKEKGDFFVMTMEYTNAINGFNANVFGLVKIISKNQMKMEFWDKNKLPEELEFSTESLIFTRE